MEHSIAAKYALRSAASFPRPSVRFRERRLGLRAAVVFRATVGPATELRLEGSGPARLRGGTRSITPTRPRRPSSGRPRHPVSMTWSRSLPVGRLSAATAPWLA